MEIWGDCESFKWVSYKLQDWWCKIDAYHQAYDCTDNIIKQSLIFSTQTCYSYPSSESEIGFNRIFGLRFANTIHFETKEESLSL